MQTLRNIASKNPDKFQKKIINKQFLIGKYFDNSKNKCMHENTHKKYTKSKTLKIMQKQIQIGKATNSLQTIPNSTNNSHGQIHPYHVYKPLNRMWVSYVQQLLKNQQNQESRQLKFLRADYHGAYVTVLDSSTETLVGVKGLVIEETLRTFKIVVDVEKDGQQEDEKKQQKQRQITVLKGVCIFLFTVPDSYNFIINGTSLVYRPSDRIKHKFKYKKSQKINLHFLQTLQSIITQSNK